jgi:predicted methyltransferase
LARWPYLAAAVLVSLLFVASRRKPTGAPPPPVEPDRYISPLYDPARASTPLEGRERDRWQRPAEIVKLLQLRKGDVVADIGAGTGYLEPYLSPAVGSNGRVYAEEIQSSFMPALSRRADKFRNIVPIFGTAEDPHLPMGGVDCFVLLTVYHEVQKPISFLTRLHKYARPNATLVIIDFDYDLKGNPPAPVDHWVSQKDVLVEAEKAGWQLLKRHTIFSSQFFLVFDRKNDRK